MPQGIVRSSRILSATKKSAGDFRRSFSILISEFEVIFLAREVKAELTNMCMVYDGSKVLVQKRCPEHGWPGVTFPGGHVEPGESITGSVIREVWEETGLTLSHPRLCGVKNWINEDGSRYIVFLYQCSEYSGELKSSEEGEVFWAERNDLPGMNLSSGMEETLEVFFRDELSELYYIPENDWEIILN